MEQKIKRDLSLINLVSDFESKFEQGNLEYVDEKIIYQLIDYYESEGLIYKAMEVIDVALEQFHYRADFHIIKAKLFLADDKTNDCLKELDKAEIISPGEKEIKALRIRVFCQKKDINKATKLLEKLKSESLKGDMPDYYVAESYLHEVTKDYKAMYQSLKKALRYDTGHEEALERFWLAVDLSREYVDSINFHKAIIDESPYNHLAWYNLGLSYSFNWEYEKAIESLEYSFIINPAFEQGYIECAELCIQEGKNKKALDIYTEANNRFGPEVDHMVNIAACYLKLNNLADAKMTLLRALKFDPNNEEIYFLLGESYSQAETWYSAITAYLKAIDIDDNREEFYLGIAKAYAKVEDYSKATINYHKATKVCSEESLYWREYVCFVLKLGLYKEALQILDEADEHTFGADLLYCRAITYFFLKKKKYGLEILDEALQEDFQMYKLVYELAPELEVDKDINSMIRYYESDLNEEF